jgi:glyoxylase-like metal-dependent hydrolase (beta-lactamase superfamily II)/rhodanese-related sulfurtransferase
MLAEQRGRMLLRQLFDPETSTYTYLLADETMREAVLIDSVREQLERDVQLLSELELRLVAALDTHVHADHVTGAGLLRARLGCLVGVGARAGVLTADLRLREGDIVRFGGHALEVRETPGHTDGCVTFVCHEEGMAFTGDALLIRGCGRTDFQQGDAATLYRSVREKILSLPAATRLHPAHDYKGRTLSTVAEEKRHNPRLGDARSLDEFVALMRGLRLAYPGRMDEAVPANLASGVTEPEPIVPRPPEPGSWAPLAATASGVPVVTAEWLAGHTREVRVVDVREHVEFCGALGHIEGAELVPLASLETTARDWDRRAPVVAVCTYGTRSGKAALLLREQGFERVASLHGGMVRWTALGLPALEVRGGRSSQQAEDADLGMGI